ncbi:hypothetical protein WJ883_08580, partial [Coxiella burnetii]
REKEFPYSAALHTGYFLFLKKNTINASAIAREVGQFSWRFHLRGEYRYPEHHVQYRFCI